MHLEIVNALPAARSNRPPLLFLHGAFSAAWVWAEHFLGFMAQAGYAAHAVSFRGHGASAGSRSLWEHRLEDYVEDAGAAVRALGRAPVLVGHSLGGLIAQLCVGRHAVAGLVLMAAVPLEGLLPAHTQLAMHDPALWLELAQLSTHGRVSAPVSPRLRRALLADELPRLLADRHLLRMEQESLRVLAELQFPRWPEAMAGTRLPALVIGREDDRLIPSDAVRRTAWLQGAELAVLPGCAHLLMLEGRWREPAELLAGWLHRNFG
jgi:pimeloyl-ACP methyl ester carboxylesterase